MSARCFLWLSHAPVNNPGGVCVFDLLWHAFVIKKFETYFSKQSALVTFPTTFDLLHYEICCTFGDNSPFIWKTVYFKLEYNTQRFSLSFLHCVLPYTTKCVDRAKSNVATQADNNTVP